MDESSTFLTGNCHGNLVNFDDVNPPPYHAHTDNYLKIVIV